MSKQRPRNNIDLGFTPEMSLKEISEQTGISESNVSHLLQNAQRKILMYLERHQIRKSDLLEE